MTEEKSQRVWMNRCKPVGNNQLEDCKRERIITIGWPDVDLSQDGWENTKWLTPRGRSMLWRFCEMRKGDWVLVPRGGDLHRAQIACDKPLYLKDKPDWAEHAGSYYETEEWKEEPWERSKMPASVQSRLKYRGTHLWLHDNYSELEKAYGKSLSARMVEELREIFQVPRESTLHADSLERMIKGLFESMHFEGVRIPGKKQSQAGDVDVEAMTPLGIQVYAQVKWHQGTSGGAGIDQLIKRKEDDGKKPDNEANAIYLFITTAKEINEDAKNKANQNDILCWDGEKLAAMLIEHGIPKD